MRKHPSSHRHPHWCAQHECATHDEEVVHTSATTRITTTDHQLDFTLQRVDEDLFPREVGGTYLLVDVANTILEGIPVVRVVLDPQAAKAVSEQLLIQALTATQPRLPIARAS